MLSRPLIVCLLAGAAALPAPLFAQQAPVPEAEHHDEVIVVTGSTRPVGDTLGGVSVLSGDLLAEELKPSIGETLASQPGVSASGIGPAAARPVLRGLSGERVRLLTDGLGSIDLSSSSADHAVAINPLTAERIEVLRGPAALQFGSSAIGGVVNVLDGRIPRRRPDGVIGAGGMLGYGSAADEKSASLALDVPVGAHWVAHGDAGWSKADDLRTGGYLLSAPFRREARASADTDVRALSDLEGRLPNSDARSSDVAAGLAYVDGGLNLGVSLGAHDAYYGVPIRYSLDPAIEPEAPHIDARQRRVDLRAAVPLTGFLAKAEVRGVVGRYRHFEIADDGAIDTIFRTHGGEVRADLTQADRGGWSGVSGVQYLAKNVTVRGEEKYLPGARQRQLGLFTLQSLETGAWRFEGGGRIERSYLTANADSDLMTPDRARDLTTISASIGGQYGIAAGWKLGLNLSRSARAPALDELFANGPHAGTQAFEVGNPGLDAEVGYGGELSLKHHQGPLHLTLSAFATRFANFIYQAPTGDVSDDLPVYAARQGKATYKGFEVEADADLGTHGGIDWTVEGIADATRAHIDGVGPAPLMPPLRLQGTVRGKAGPIEARLGAEHGFRQNRTAPLETPTPGYTTLNAGLDWTPLADRPRLTLSLDADNILDATVRRSTSLLKDFAPAAGRDIRLSARFSY